MESKCPKLKTKLVKATRRANGTKAVTGIMKMLKECSVGAVRAACKHMLTLATTGEFANRCEQITHPLSVVHGAAQKRSNVVPPASRIGTC